MEIAENRVFLGRFRAIFALTAVVLLGIAPASAAITAIKIAKDETISAKGIAARHIVGKAIGEAKCDEPGVPTLKKVKGVKYESDFELWLPIDKVNGRFWFSVLNRGNDLGNLRDGILRRGGAYGWCAWQAKNFNDPRPQLKLSGFTGPMPQAYGMIVVQDFVTFLRYSPDNSAAPNPAAGKIQFAFTYGISQSGGAVSMRTFLLYGLNAGARRQGVRWPDARRRKSRLSRRLPSELRSRLRRNLQRRDRTRSLFVVGSYVGYEAGRESICRERRERVFRDDGLHDPPRDGAGERPHLRLSPGRSRRRRNRAPGTSAFSR